MNGNTILGLVMLTLLLADHAPGQASFQFGNFNPPSTDAPVFDAQGVPLAGANYRAELWGAATPDSLAPLVVIFEGNRREIVPFLTDGYFASGSGSLSVTSVVPGGWAWLQARAWDGRLGATYEDVTALGIGGYGESQVFYQQGGNPYDLLGVPPRLVGLKSFSLLPVIPEPSIWQFGLLGAAGLLWFHRRRRRIANSGIQK